MERQIALLKTYGITTLCTLVFYVTFTLVDWTCTFTDSNARQPAAVKNYREIKSV
jgi:hypothetical protein